MNAWLKANAHKYSRTGAQPKNFDVRVVSTDFESDISRQVLSMHTDPEHVGSFFVLPTVEQTERLQIYRLVDVWGRVCEAVAEGQGLAYNASENGQDWYDRAVKEDSLDTITATQDSEHQLVLQARCFTPLHVDHEHERYAPFSAVLVHQAIAHDQDPLSSQAFYVRDHHEHSIRAGLDGVHPFHQN